MKHLKAIRQTIGVLIIALPFVSVLFGLIGIAYNPANWWNSISATYYTNSKVMMIGIISICAFFFCTYQGYDWKDRLVNIASGVSLYMILLFPCGDKNLAISGDVGIFLIDKDISNIVHSVFAILAFLGFFINIMFLFTKTDGNPTEEKKNRNRLYRICAMVIPVISLPCIVVANIFWSVHWLVLVGEAVALVSCGIAWLVKGETFSFMNDLHA